MTQTLTSPWQSRFASRVFTLFTHLAVLSMVAVLPGELAAQAGAPGVVTVTSLVQRMVDRDAVAEFAAYANSSGVESSKDPQARTHYFFSNTDGGNFQRNIIGASGGTEHVMLDITGPGALTRLFVAGPSFAGHRIRVYLDDSTSPVLTTDLNTLMTGGDFVGPPFVYAAGPNPVDIYGLGQRPPGLNLYLPIPFALHALVTYDGPANINDQNTPQPILDFVWEYTRYLPGTGVTTFTPAQYTSAKAALAPYTNQLSATQNTTLPTTAAYAGGTNTPLFNQSLAPGASVSYTLNAQNGGSALRLLQANVGTALANLEGITLRIDFDGDGYCVNESIGDFFGSGEGLHAGTTQMQSVGTDGTMTERWTMPFQTKAVITLTNTTGNAIPIFLAGTVGAYGFGAYTMHFHAYRRINGPMYIPSLAHTMRMINILGKGVLVGDSQTTTTAQPGGDTTFNWWGEGDELIYVDRSQFPTHRGTGSEDYYGYAYGHTTLFQSPWTSQTAVPPVNGVRFNYDGATVLNRNRLLDVVPFNNHLRYDFEIHENNDPRAQIQIDHTTYFYALPGTVSLVPDGVISGNVYTLENKICGWILGADAGNIVTGTPAEDGTQRFKVTALIGNEYQLQNIGTGLYLSATGTSLGSALNLRAYTGTCDQKWTIANVSDSGTVIPDAVGNGFNGYQSLVNACGYAADVVNGSTLAGTTVQQYTNTGAESQIWRFNLSTGVGDPILPNGVYQILNADGLAIDVPNGAATPGLPLQAYTNNGSAAQTWTVNYIANGVYSIVNVGTALALDNGSVGSGGGTAVQKSYTSTPAQQFAISPRGSAGFYSIRNISNNLVLSVGGNRMAPSPVVQYPLGSGQDQTWQFHVVTYP